jgi:alkanesulfonate monooxygenase SsuD/methylene tetrahydromethanopterin reductase-like flavin-dependent oxidoreductase (luciferase family)
MARSHAALFRAAIAGAGVAAANPQMTGADGLLPIAPQSPGLTDRIWWGSGTRQTAAWVGEQGMNLMSSTLLTEDTGVPFDELQAEQVAIFRSAWAEAGWEREPRVSVSRSVIPIVSDLDRAYFGGRAGSHDQLGYLEGVVARFGRSYTGEPDVIAEELSRDAAVREADTILLTVPNQLGVDYNAQLLETIARHVGPAIGWEPATASA